MISHTIYPLVIIDNEHTKLYPTITLPPNLQTNFLNPSSIPLLF